MSDTPTLLDRFRDPLADPARDRSRLRLSAMLIGMGVLHFVVPKPFRSIVPRWFPWPREAVAVSGVAELASGVLLAVPGSQRVGGALGFVTIAAVYPANVQMAIDASRGVGEQKIPAWLLWLRVPLQVPLLRTAWQFASGT